MGLSALAGSAVSSAVATIQARTFEISLMAVGVAVGSWLDNINGFAAGIGAFLVMAFLAFLTRRRDADSRETNVTTNAISLSEILGQRMEAMEKRLERTERQLVEKDMEIAALRQSNVALEGRFNQLFAYSQALYAVVLRAAPSEAARLGDPALYSIAPAPPTQPLTGPLTATLTATLAAPPGALEVSEKPKPRPQRKRARTIPPAGHPAAIVDAAP